MVILGILLLISIVSLAIILERAVFFWQNRSFSLLDGTRYLNMLSTFVSVSPLLGILGTIFGIMHSFGGYTESAPDMRVIAYGISIALRATAFGLSIAIVDLFFYNFYQHCIDTTEASGKLIIPPSPALPHLHGEGVGKI